jgi:hypothetical protein
VPDLTTGIIPVRPTVVSYPSSINASASSSRALSRSLALAATCRARLPFSPSNVAPTAIAAAVSPAEAYTGSSTASSGGTVQV